MEPDHGVGGGPGVQLSLIEPLTVSNNLALKENLSEEEVPVLLLVCEGPCHNSVLPVGSNKPVVHSIVGAVLFLFHLLVGFHFKLVPVVDPAVFTVVVVGGDTSSLEVNLALDSTVSRVFPLLLVEVILGVGVGAVEELDVLLGLGVVKHKLRGLFTINCHDSVHLHLGNEEDALVDLVKEHGHLPLNILGVSASVPVHHAVEGRLLSHGHLVKVLHLDLLDDILTVGDLVGHGEASVGGVLPASLIGP